MHYIYYASQITRTVTVDSGFRTRPAGETNADRLTVRRRCTTMPRCWGRE